MKNLKKLVLANAVQNAKENAEVLAKSSGVTLGKLQHIDYGYTEIHISERYSDMICYDRVITDDMYDADIDPEDVVASDSVTLVYEILD